MQFNISFGEKHLLAIAIISLLFLGLAFAGANVLKLAPPATASVPNPGHSSTEVVINAAGSGACSGDISLQDAIDNDCLGGGAEVSPVVSYTRSCSSDGCTVSCEPGDIRTDCSVVPAGGAVNNDLDYAIPSGLNSCFCGIYNGVGDCVSTCVKGSVVSTYVRTCNSSGCVTSCDPGDIRTDCTFQSTGGAHNNDLDNSRPTGANSCTCSFYGGGSHSCQAICLDSDATALTGYQETCTADGCAAYCNVGDIRTGCSYYSTGAAHSNMVDMASPISSDSCKCKLSGAGAHTCYATCVDF